MDGGVESAGHGHNILIVGNPRLGKRWITRPFLQTAHPPTLLSVRYRPRRRLRDPRVALALWSLAVRSNHRARATAGDPDIVEDLKNGKQLGDRTYKVQGGLGYGAGLALSGGQNRDRSFGDHARGKMSYLSKLLPMLAAQRRSIGLPHWIVVDEANRFLHQPDVGQRVTPSRPTAFERRFRQLS